MIYNVAVVGHSQKDRFADALNAAVTAAQADGLEVEIQYAGKGSGYYSALVISRQMSS